MKTYVIQLDRHDDVAAIGDKIAWSKASRVLLVWPKRGRVFTRLLDLQLIQRACLAVGAQLACVTEDEDIWDHAQALGIPVFGSAKVAQRLPWRRQRWKKVLEPKRMRPLGAILQARSDAHPRGWAWLERAGVRWAVFGLGLLAVVGLVLALIPAARIGLALRAEPQTMELPVFASAELNAVNLSGGVPARALAIVMEDQATQETSGSLLVPESAASGKVTFTNLSDQRVTVPSGTVVQTVKEPVIQFATTQSVELTGKLKATAEAPVQALRAGSEGNVATGAVRAVEGEIGARVTVTNPAGMSGGRDLRSRAASREDWEQLKEHLLGRLKQNAEAKLREQLPPGSRLLPQTLAIARVLVERQEPPLGAASDQIKLTLQVEVQALTVRDEDLSTLAQMALDTQLGPEKVVLAGSLGIQEIDPPAWDGERLRWRVRATRLVRATWSDPVVIRAVAGQSLEAARRNLEASLELTTPPEIEVYPSGWPVLPWVPGRIQVEVK